ncbi:MAG: PspA/IM30 family protein [Ktedonobacterales bacterium]
MGVLSRFTNYIKTVMSSFLDRSEDPGQTLDYSYEKQLEQLQNLRRSIADVVTNEKRLELQKAQLQTQSEKWDEGARKALAANNDELARAALERKQAIQSQLSGFDTQIEQLKAQQDKFLVMQQRLTASVEAFRTQKEMVKAQYGAASAQVKIQEAASGLSEQMADVNLAVQRAQDRVLTMQARASALDELTSSGALPEIGPGGTVDPLERQIAQLSNQSSVDSELASLKAQMQLPSGGSQQAQLPPASTSTITQDE